MCQCSLSTILCRSMYPLKICSTLYSFLYAIATLFPKALLLPLEFIPLFLLFVIELIIAEEPGFSKKQVGIFFTPRLLIDASLAMEVYFRPQCMCEYPVRYHIIDLIYFIFFWLQFSQKYGLISVITKLGVLFIYDLETATQVYRDRITSDPILLTAESSTTGGFYAINTRGQVLHATINDATIVPFVRIQVYMLSCTSPINSCTDAYAFLCILVHAVEQL